MQKTFVNKYMIGVATLAIVAGSALLMSAAMAAETDLGDTGCPFAGERPVMTEEQQAVMDEVRSLHEQGLDDEAQALAEEAGLPTPPLHMGRMGKDHGPRAEVQEAVANNDYEAFVELTANAPFVDQITEETFATMVEAHTLRESGDLEGAHALMESLGFNGRGPHHGPQFHSHTTE